MFSQIDDSQSYTTSGDSLYMDAQIVRMTYNLALQSVKTKEAWRDWRRLPSNDQTWKNFVRDFKAAHLYLQHESTLESAVFQAHFSEQAHLTKEFLNVTLANQTHMENLAQDNLATTEKVTNLISTITSLKNQMRTLSTWPPCSVRSNDKNRNTGGRVTWRSQCRVNMDLKCANGTRTYCWSHGGSITATHNISNCNYKFTGHNDAAIFANRFCGSTFYCETTWTGGIPKNASSNKQNSLTIISSFNHAILSSSLSYLPPIQHKIADTG